MSPNINKILVGIMKNQSTDDFSKLIWRMLEFSIWAHNFQTAVNYRQNYGEDIPDDYDGEFYCKTMYISQSLEILAALVCDEFKDSKLDRDGICFKHKTGKILFVKYDEYRLPWSIEYNLSDNS